MRTKRSWMFKMAKKIYLEGGGVTLEEETKEIDSQAVQDAEKKSIYVLDMTRRDEEKIIKYREFFVHYFKDMGAEEINFASTSSPEKIRNGIAVAGVLYVPGGDTEYLIDQVHEKELVDVIKSFEGVIIGMSAGAYLMCKEYTKIKEDETKMVNALEIVDIRMKAHYDSKFDSQLIKLSQEKDIYGVSDKAAIIVRDKELTFVGNVYLFSKGKKTKLN